MYRVAWGPGVWQKLAEVYDRLGSQDRDKLMASLESLDARLAERPLDVGESRNAPTIRVAIEIPLLIEFRIDESQQIVQVSGVSYIRRIS